MSSHHRGMLGAVSSEGRDLAESWLLCHAMLGFAVGWLAWSLPSPSALDALLVLLCLALVVIEQRRSSARFREVMVQAGEAVGTAAREAQRGAGPSDGEGALPARQAPRAALAEGGEPLTPQP